MLEPVSPKHAVLRLLYNGLVKVKLLANFNSLSDSICRPFGGAPVESLIVLDDPVHSTACLFQWGLVIRSVAEYHINVVEL